MYKDYSFLFLCFISQTFSKLKIVNNYAFSFNAICILNLGCSSSIYIDCY